MVVVEVEVRLQPALRLDAIGVVVQIDLLVLDRPPQPLNEDVVAIGRLHRGVDGDAAQVVLLHAVPQPYRSNVPGTPACILD